ncbi:hypothetical protein ACHAP5_010314 [Fusarium lateritium]
MTPSQDLNKSPTLPETPLLSPSIRDGTISPLESLSNDTPTSNSSLSASGVKEIFDQMSTNNITLGEINRKHVEDCPSPNSSPINKILVMEDVYEPMALLGESQHREEFFQVMSTAQDATGSNGLPTVYGILQVIRKELHAIYQKIYENERRLGEIEEEIRNLLCYMDRHQS